MSRRESRTQTATGPSGSATGGPAATSTLRLLCYSRRLNTYTRSSSASIAAVVAKPVLKQPGGGEGLAIEGFGLARVVDRRHFHLCGAWRQAVSRPWPRPASTSRAR